MSGSPNTTVAYRPDYLPGRTRCLLSHADIDSHLVEKTCPSSTDTPTETSRGLEPMGSPLSFEDFLATLEEMYSTERRHAAERLSARATHLWPRYWIHGQWRRDLPPAEDER